MTKLEEAAEKWCDESGEYRAAARVAFKAAAKWIYEEASRFEEQKAEKYIRRNAPYIKMKDLAEICEVGE